MAGNVAWRPAPAAIAGAWAAAVCSAAVLLLVVALVIKGYCRCPACELQACSLLGPEHDVTERPSAWRVSCHTAKTSPNHNGTASNRSVEGSMWVACPAEGEEGYSPRQHTNPGADQAPSDSAPDFGSPAWEPLDISQSPQPPPLPLDCEQLQALQQRCLGQDGARFRQLNRSAGETTGGWIARSLVSVACMWSDCCMLLLAADAAATAAQAPIQSRILSKTQSRKCCWRL